MHRKPRILRRKEREWIERNVLLPIARRLITEIEKAILYGEQSTGKEKRNE